MVGWLAALRLLWQSGRGHRLRPWRSPYLRWRIETYSGLAAERVDAAAFLRFAWRERATLVRYLRWAGQMRSGQVLPATRSRRTAGR